MYFRKKEVFRDRRVALNISESDKEELVLKVIRSYEKGTVRPKSRKREKFIRKYGTDLPVIKAMMLTGRGLAIALNDQGNLKEVFIPLEEHIPNYMVLLNSKKLKHLFHEESLLVDVYMLGEGVLYTIELMYSLFDELL